MTEKRGSIWEFRPFLRSWRRLWRVPSPYLPYGYFLYSSGHGGLVNSTGNSLASAFGPPRSQQVSHFIPFLSPHPYRIIQVFRPHGLIFPSSIFCQNVFGLPASSMMSAFSSSGKKKKHSVVKLRAGIVIYGLSGTHVHRHFKAVSNELWYVYVRTVEELSSRGCSKLFTPCVLLVSHY